MCSNVIITFLLAISLSVGYGTVFKVSKKNANDKVGCVVCHPLDQEKINIHLVPHSHDDIGWLKSFDEYYYGLNTLAAGFPIAVRNIISSVVEELLKNKDRRFIQVETAYFYKWWKEQDEGMRLIFKTLVDSGQLEMVSGGWSMNDEACTNYQSIIDQFTLGFRIIEETIGKCGRSRVGWQIDPFGHSREHASILAQMGYNGMFFSRLDHADRLKREKNHTLNFAWQGSSNLDDSFIFGSIFPNDGYGPPKDFCWDMICGDEQIVDDFDSIYYNLDKKVNRFSAALDEYVKLYSEDNRNILVTMGGDFHYQQANYIFDNIDRLIKGFKNHKKYNLIYSTPSCYLKSIHDSKINLTLKTDDFFPYSTDEHSFWTGYFSSRPTLKRFERVGHNILQATKQMYALSSNSSHDEKLTDLNQAMGTLQHHNAITGTQKTHVTSDYVRTLTAAIIKAEEPVTDIISELLEAKTKLDWSLNSCLLTNVSICSTSQKSDKFVVAVYNPLAWNITHYVRLPVEEGEYIINGPDGKEEYDLIEPLSSFSFVKIKNELPSAFELIFAAKNVEPLGLKIYHIEKQNKKVEKNNQDPSQLSTFKLNEKTNLLHNVTLNDITLKVKQNFFIYKSGIGTADDNLARSGAYIFRPTEDKPEELTDVTLVKTYIGTFVEEVIQKWTSDRADIYQAIRWYKNENYIELDWLVGNINIKDNVGKEIVSRFEVTDFNNKNIFYTDSNGRETIQRIKDKRGDYSYDPTKEPVASNYYPVTSKIVVKDEEKNIQVAVLTDRSQGGTSLETNQIELMVHRRTITDDGMGVGEPLSETEFDLEVGMYARGSHYLAIGDTKKVNKYGTTTTGQERILAHKKLLQPWIGLSPTKQTFDELKKSINLKYSAINEELPENINILTLEPWISDKVLLRFEHIMEKGEDPKLSTKATFNLKNLVKGIDAHTITETTLGANVPLNELHDEPRYVWNIKNETNKGVSLGIRNIGANGELSLNPMQIRTFIVSRKSNNSSRNVASFTLFIFLILSKLFFV